MVVIYWNEDFLGALWFFLGIMELSDIRVLQGLICSKSLARVKLKKALKKVKSFLRCSGEHVSQLFGLGRRETLKHGLG